MLNVAHQEPIGKPRTFSAEAAHCFSTVWFYRLLPQWELLMP